jgi:hypothetical protein
LNVDEAAPSSIVVQEAAPSSAMADEGAASLNHNY